MYGYPQPFKVPCRRPDIPDGKMSAREHDIFQAHGKKNLCLHVGMHYAVMRWNEDHLAHGILTRRCHLQAEKVNKLFEIHLDPTKP